MGKSLRGLSRWQLLFVSEIAVLVLSLAAGCGGRKAQFIEGRTLDHCDESWPVCDQIAGCVLGDQSYLEGRFPGDGKFVVRLEEPSVVRVAMFLENINASGEQSDISWFEDGCRARTRQSVDGRTLVGETEKQGYFAREAELSATGDHLIRITSDAKADYTLKVEVVPRRLLPQ